MYRYIYSFMKNKKKEKQMNELKKTLIVKKGAFRLWKLPYGQYIDYSWNPVLYIKMFILKTGKVLESHLIGK